MTSRNWLLWFGLASVACASSTDDTEAPVDGPTKATRVFVDNQTSGALTAEWNEDLVVNSSDDFSSPSSVPAAKQVELGTDWDWGRVPLTDITPELRISDENGTVLYELPVVAGYLPDDGHWTLRGCEEEAACEYVLTIE